MYRKNTGSRRQRRGFGAVPTTVISAIAPPAPGFWGGPNDRNQRERAASAGVLGRSQRP